MKFVVRPELPTAALRSSQATLAAVDNSAPLATRRSPLKTRGNVVQTTGATSLVTSPYAFLMQNRTVSKHVQIRQVAMTSYDCSFLVLSGDKILGRVIERLKF